ncbi:hypothetical protein ABH944_008334 [Caballeronia udeis]|uniref:Uncharacterized protein n=2 Tax=Caballeronia udeis TaxID=1232866 RepID=A0ABW8MZT6_9BURK
MANRLDLDCRKIRIISGARYTRIWGFRGTGILILAMALNMLPGHACAFEADVHYGLTRWLAGKAGFDKGEAEAIALGDQRVDGGLIQNMKTALQYACLSPYPEDAAEVQSLHYPSAQPVPSQPERRVVIPGDRQALALAEKLVAQAHGKAGFMLQLFGRSLHPLQDSFAHQGVPSLMESLSPEIDCDPGLSMSAPKERQSNGYHRAELTRYWPQDVLQMAQSTYAMMSKYPAVDGKIRKPALWGPLAQEIETFSRAATKSEKATWFQGQGFDDVSFLDGTSLPDGKHWTPVRWHGRKLPSFTTNASSQPGVDPAILQFYNSLFSDWLTGSAHLGKLATYIRADATRVTAGQANNVELELWLWRLRDHGSVTALLADSNLKQSTMREKATVSIQRPGAIEFFRTVSDGVLPLMIESDKPSPLLPYVVFRISNATPQRTIAIVRLLDAPYETLGIVSDVINGRRKVTGLVSTFDY